MPQPLIRDGKVDREAVAVELRRYLDLILARAQLDLAYDIRPEEPADEALENPEVLVVFRGRDLDLLLEHGAELLQALEYIGLRWLHLDPRFYDRVRFDAGDFRALRIEELKLSAQVAANRVRENHQPFRFNPMTARERRIIHLALKDTPGVRTTSEGDGEKRQVVIFPAEAK